MRTRVGVLLLGVSLCGCPVQDSELIGARCDSNSLPCGSGGLMCDPRTNRCVLASGLDGGGGAGGGGMGGGTGGGGGGTGCTLQPFETIDDFAPVGCPAALAAFVSVVSSPSPQVIVGGLVGCPLPALVLRSLGPDGGWSTLADGQDGGPGRSPVPRGMAVSQGSVFLVGDDEDVTDGGATRLGWRVWRKTLGSASPLVEVDSSSPGSATGIAVSPAGHVFVAGTRDGQLVVRRWDGGSWSDAFVHPSPRYCPENPIGLAIDSSGNLHLTGSRVSATAIPFDAGTADRCDLERPWFTMTLTNDGTQWDGGFVQQSGTEATAQGIGAAPNGNLFTIGHGTAVRGWFVRRSFDRGQSWEASDFWHPNPIAQCVPASVTAAGNRTWIAGGCVGDAGIGKWALRTLDDSPGSQWVTSDFWSDGSTPATAVSVAIDAQETVYVAGYAELQNRWIVRRARCQ